MMRNVFLLPFLFHRLLEDDMLLNVEKALVLANSKTGLWQKEKQQKYTQGHVLSGDLSESVVVVCGIVLPRNQLAQKDQVGIYLSF